MPGLDKFPLNRCGIFESNQAFIEAYMVGLNHEMAREMLWREFPADLRQTFFRQFWDKRDTPATGFSTVRRNEGHSSDREMGKADTFGDASHRGGRRPICCFLSPRRPAAQVSEHGRFHATGHSQDRRAGCRMKPSRCKMPVVRPPVCRNLFPRFRCAEGRKRSETHKRQAGMWLAGTSGRYPFRSGPERRPTSPTEPNGKTPTRCRDNVSIWTKPKPLLAGLRHAADVAVLFLPTAIHDAGSCRQRCFPKLP